MGLLLSWCWTAPRQVDNTKQSHNSKKAHCRTASHQLPDVHSLVVFQVWLVIVRCFNGVHRLWRRRCMRSNRIIYNAENRLARRTGLLINQFDNAAFQSFLQCRIVPFSMIQKISYRCSVMLADNRKINGLTAVSTEKDRNNNGH